MQSTIDTQMQYKVTGDNLAEKEAQVTLNLRVSTRNSNFIIHRLLVQQLMAKRQGNAHTKTRSEVRGGGKKPWKQKGTGKARCGSSRSPLWRGGGVVFGPREKEYSKKINIKEKKLAIRTLLYNKREQILFVHQNRLNLTIPSTKLLKQFLCNVQVAPEAKSLLIVNEKNLNLYLASRNLQNIEVVQANNLNIISLLNANQIIITADSVQKIQEVYT